MHERGDDGQAAGTRAWRWTLPAASGGALVQLATALDDDHAAQPERLLAVAMCCVRGPVYRLLFGSNPLLDLITPRRFRPKPTGQAAKRPSCQALKSALLTDMRTGASLSTPTPKEEPPKEASPEAPGTAPLPPRVAAARVARGRARRAGLRHLGRAGQRAGDPALLAAARARQAVPQVSEYTPPLSTLFWR